ASFHNVLRYISTPYFILNSAYDVFQFHHILVPPSANMHGHWNKCKLDPAACTPLQIAIFQDFRLDMLATLRPFAIYLGRGGMFINSCFAHCQSESQDTWFEDDSPRINKTIAEAVGDWYFSRKRSKEIDYPYPCDTTCHNLIPYPRGNICFLKILYTSCFGYREDLRSIYLIKNLECCKPIED
ncbi:hypothetical protein HN51_050825, partial [Arachis hypogaea]